MNNKNGFTLIELMIIIAIIAIVSAVVIPNAIGWMSNRRIRSAVEEMGATIQLARQRAIREDADVVIKIDVGNDACEIFIDDGQGAGGVASNQTRDGSEALLAPVILPEGVDMTSTFDGGWFGYTGRGLPIGSKEGEIHLKNTAGSYLGVRVDIAGSPTIIQSDNGSSWY